MTDMIISKKDFIFIVTNYETFTNLIDKLHKLGIDLINGDLHELPCIQFDKIIELFFDEEGGDWISYYLYENPDKRYFVDEEEKKLEDLDDLWELVKDHRR